MTLPIMALVFGAAGLAVLAFRIVWRLRKEGVGELRLRLEILERQVNDDRSFLETECRLLEARLYKGRRRVKQAARILALLEKRLREPKESGFTEVLEERMAEAPPKTAVSITEPVIPKPAVSTLELSVPESPLPDPAPQERRVEEPEAGDPGGDLYRTEHEDTASEVHSLIEEYKAPAPSIFESLELAPLEPEPAPPLPIPAPFPDEAPPSRAQQGPGKYPRGVSPLVRHVLSLAREGQSEEAIARELKIGAGAVGLMLRLHGAGQEEPFAASSL